MAKYSKQEITNFQKLYLHYYGKNLTLEETKKRFDALVRLLRLVRDVPTKKPSSNIETELNIKGKSSENQSRQVQSISDQINILLEIVKTRSLEIAEIFTYKGMNCQV